MNKNYTVAVVLLLSLLCVSCAKTEVLEENAIEDIEAEEMKETEVNELKADADDMEGWEYKAEDYRYFYGTWVVTSACWGPSSLKETEHSGSILELGPDSFHYYNDDIWGEEIIELKYYYVTPVSTRWAWQRSSYSDKAGQEAVTEPYAISLEDVAVDKISLFSEIMLIGEKEMIAYMGPHEAYYLEKIADWEGDVYENFEMSGAGIWVGDWKITGALKADNERENPIGEVFSTEDMRHNKDIIENENMTLSLWDAKDSSIRKLVEALELQESPCVVCYAFSEDIYWDKMILKDEMTAVFVKDGNYYWAERISEREEYGVYGAWI